LTGYEFYASLKCSLFISAAGDCLDRYALRLNEIIESSRVIYAVVYVLLESFSFVSCSACSTVSLMEWLICEFLLSFPLVLSFASEVKLNIESSKGIYSVLVQSFPRLTVNILTSDYLSISQANNFSRHSNLGDLVVLLGSIDFVLGSVDLLGLLASFTSFSSFMLSLVLTSSLTCP
jgi:NADH:ubiquinone oxidoreductase subunit D